MEKGERPKKTCPKIARVPENVYEQVVGVGVHFITLREMEINALRRSAFLRNYVRASIEAQNRYSPVG